MTWLLAVRPLPPQQAPPPDGLSIPGLTTGLHTAAPPAGGLFFLLFYGSEDYEEWSSSTALVSLDQQYFPMAAEIIPAASRTMDVVLPLPSLMGSGKWRGGAAQRSRSGRQILVQGVPVHQRRDDPLFGDTKPCRMAGDFHRILQRVILQ